MSTFSQIVDDMLAEHLRPDMRMTVVAYLNQTIRELHSVRNTSVPILYDSNRHEAALSVDAEPYLWVIPSVPRFQKLDTVWYSLRGVYSEQRHLSVAHRLDVRIDPDVYWYRTGNQIAFSGVALGEEIQLSYFMFPRALVYYQLSDRPATWNVESESFSYNESYDIDDETRAQAEELVTNWLLLRWAEVIKEGVRAKIFKRLGDEIRARLAYSAYEAFREQVHTSEAWSLGVRQ